MNYIQLSREVGVSNINDISELLFDSRFSRSERIELIRKLRWAYRYMRNSMFRIMKDAARDESTLLSLLSKESVPDELSRNYERRYNISFNRLTRFEFIQLLPRFINEFHEVFKDEKYQDVRSMNFMCGLERLAHNSVHPTLLIPEEIESIQELAYEENSITRSKDRDRYLRQTYEAMIKRIKSELSSSDQALLKRMYGQNSYMDRLLPRFQSKIQVPLFETTVNCFDINDYENCLCDNDPERQTISNISIYIARRIYERFIKSEDLEDYDELCRPNELGPEYAIENIDYSFPFFYGDEYLFKLCDNDEAKIKRFLYENMYERIAQLLK